MFTSHWLALNVHFFTGLLSISSELVYGSVSPFQVIVFRSWLRPVPTLRLFCRWGHRRRMRLLSFALLGVGCNNHMFHVCAKLDFLFEVLQFARILLLYLFFANSQFMCA